MGYHKDGEYYNFLDDYSQHGNKALIRKKAITLKSSFIGREIHCSVLQAEQLVYVSGAGGVSKRRV